MTLKMNQQKDRRETLRYTILIRLILSAMRSRPKTHSCYSIQNVISSPRAYNNVKPSHCTAHFSRQRERQTQVNSNRSSLIQMNGKLKPFSPMAQAQAHCTKWIEKWTKFVFLLCSGVDIVIDPRDEVLVARLYCFVQNAGCRCKLATN